MSAEDTEFTGSDAAHGIGSNGFVRRPPRRISAQLSPWAKIKRAADNGFGVRLNAEEVFQLSRDGALMTRALADELGVDEL